MAWILQKEKKKEKKKKKGLRTVFYNYFCLFIFQDTINQIISNLTYLI